MNRTPALLTAFGIVFLSILFAFVVGAGVAHLGATLWPDRNQHFFTVLSLFIGQGVMILPLIGFLWYQGASFPLSLRLHPVSFRTLLTTIWLSLGVVIITDEIDRLTNLIFPQPDFFNQLVEQLQADSTVAVILLALAIVVFAPLGEELLFRGFLQQRLELLWKDITRAVLVTSMFFALIHMNPYWIIQIYLLGVILGYLAWRTGSVLPSFILHGLNNGLALILNREHVFIERYYSWNGHVSPLWLVVAISLVIIGFKQLPVTVEDSA
jgi:membrane protease YdiL (CAAX protease family)